MSQEHCKKIYGFCPSLCLSFVPLRLLASVVNLDSDTCNILWQLKKIRWLHNTSCIIVWVFGWSDCKIWLHPAVSIFLSRKTASCLAQVTEHLRREGELPAGAKPQEISTPQGLLNHAKTCKKTLRVAVSEHNEHNEIVWTGTAFSASWWFWTMRSRWSEHAVILRSTTARSWRRSWRRHKQQLETESNSFNYLETGWNWYGMCDSSSVLLSFVFSLPFLFPSCHCWENFSYVSILCLGWTDQRPVLWESGKAFELRSPGKLWHIDEAQICA